MLFQKADIEKILKVNGVSVDDPDDEIKSVLISAQWHKDDIEAAILVLRENKVSHQTHVDSLHKVFRSDERLRPETISSLLGIEMDVTSKDIEIRHRQFKRGMSAMQVTKMAFISLALSLIFVFVSMWYLQMGLFHQTLI